MKLIPLSKGKFAQVDDSDYEWLNHWGWHIHESSLVLYARRNFDNIRMHRLIMELIDPNIQIDHMDRDGLNNQRSNLRLATISQNQMNKKGHSKYSSYKGVTFEPKRNMWRADIQTQSERRRKSFKTEIEAAKWHDVVAKELHGEFAYLNFPQPVPV